MQLKRKGENRKDVCYGSLTESAEHLDVTEDFLEKAISYYKGKYGISTKIDIYIIFFEPATAVLELTAQTVPAIY